MAHTVSHRAHHHARRHRTTHAHRKHGYRKGWLPPLPVSRHLPGKWSHKHCKDWHRSHYYFYGYQQWVKWNPDKSRAYFRRHYHQ